MGNGNEGNGQVGQGHIAYVNDPAVEAVFALALEREEPSTALWTIIRAGKIAQVYWETGSSERKAFFSRSSKKTTLPPCETTCVTR
jgi:hypothetical protein